MRGRIYRDDIPPEIRLTYHIFEGMPYFEKGTEEISYFPANFKLREKNLERWYDSVNPNIIPAILGNGQLKKLLEETISTLRVRHEKVIKLRFGWNDSRPRTLEEVSKEIGTTKERPRQIEYKVLRRLKHPSRRKKIKEYLKQQYQEYQQSLFQ